MRRRPAAGRPRNGSRNGSRPDRTSRSPFEIPLHGKRVRSHEPGTVLILRTEQERHAFAIRLVGGAHTRDVQRKQGQSRRVGIRFGTSKLGPTAACVLLSTADFVLTWLLLQRSPASVYESNPVAAYFLALWGTTGLAGFKIAMVMLITAFCRVIASKSALTARRILDFASATGSSVVIYSASLALQYC